MKVTVSFPLFKVVMHTNDSGSLAEAAKNVVRMGRNYFGGLYFKWRDTPISLSLVPGWGEVGGGGLV